MEYEVILEDYCMKIEGAEATEDKLNNKISPGYCQTCLTTRKHNKLQDMMQKHDYDGKCEVYSEMLYYCFSLQLESNPKQKITDLYLICEVCIKKLRDVVKFRSQVENAQHNIRQKLDAARTFSIPNVNRELVKITEEFSPLSDIIEGDTSSSDDHSTHSSIFQSSISNSSQRKGRIHAIDVSEKNAGDGFLLRNIKRISKPERLLTKRLGYSDLPYKLDCDQLQCNVCKITFETHRRLQSHMPTHFPNFTCEICGKVFANAQQWNVHKTCHPTETFKCSLCPGKIFKTRAYQQIHMKSKHGSKTFMVRRCPHCTERFMNYDQRQRHLVDFHGGVPQVFKCNVCVSTFKSSSLRSKHVRSMHLNERNHVCKICNNAFFAKGGLTRHMLKHSGAKDFSCEVCKKSFPRKFTLNEHMKIHTGEKKHVCHICNKAFTQKCSLKGHVASHDRDGLKEES